MIEKAVLEFVNERNKINERRKYWSSTFKNELLKFLEKVKKEYIDVDWYIEHTSKTENFETISICIANRPCGVKTDEGKLLMLTGGALHFAQTLNGKVLIWMEYPYVKDYSHHNPPHLTLGNLEPEELSDLNITNYIISFLTKQTEMGIISNRTPIGFK